MGCGPGATEAATIHIFLSCSFGRLDVRRTVTSSFPARNPLLAASSRVNNGVYIFFSAVVGSHIAAFDWTNRFAGYCGWPDSTESSRG